MFRQLKPLPQAACRSAIFHGARMDEWGGRACACLLATLLALALAQPAQAAAITVNSSCSISNAIKAAENDTATGGCSAGSGADTITLAQNATLSEDPPDITTDITIEGAGYSLSGDDKYKFFEVRPAGSVKLNNLTLKKGKGGNYYLFVVFGSFAMSNSALVDSATDDGWSLIGLAPGAGKTARISNSTIVTPADPDVAAISVATNAESDMTFDHVTIVSTGYIGLYIGSAASAQKVYLRNSLVGGPGGSEGWPNCYITGGGSLKETKGSLIRDNTCSPAASGDPLLGTFTGSPGYYPIREDSPAANIGDASICATYAKDLAGEDRASTNCNAGAVEAEYDAPANNIGNRGISPQATAIPVARAASYSPSRAWGRPKATRAPYTTCDDFQGPRISVRGHNLGTQCQEVLTEAAIGDAQIRAEGWISALDVWGYLGAGIQVCFDQPGKMILLDAAFAPRRIVPLHAYQENGLTCVRQQRAGTVVLQEQASEARADENRPLAGCMVRLNASLRFRRTPGGTVRTVLPAGVKLTALQRTRDWFHVDYHGERGWVSAQWVSPQGICA